MEIQANPDLEQLKLILWISGPMLFAMLAVIGYFLKQQIEASNTEIKVETMAKERTKIVSEIYGKIEKLERACTYVCKKQWFFDLGSWWKSI